VDNWTNQWTNLIAQHLKYWFDHSGMPESKSVIKMIWINSLPEASCMIAFLNTRHRNKR